MKIRKGFVTNSSSSSFVCLGVSADSFTIKDSFYLEVGKENLEWYKERSQREGRYQESNKKEYDLLKNMTDEELLEYGKENFDLDNFDFPESVTYGGEEDYEYIGVEIDSLFKMPDLKFGDAKKYVAEQLSKVSVEEITEEDISYEEQGWYNG